MANIFTLRTLLDGPRHAVIHAYLASDGSSGELSAQVLADASTLSGAPTKLTIEEVKWDFIGFDALLLFDATTDAPALALSGDFGAQKIKICEYGGLADPQGSGYTGDILITTSGFTATVDKGHLFIKVRKD